MIPLRLFTQSHKKIFAKTNMFLNIPRAYLKSSSLISDLNYIKQNITRIMRSLCEICLYKGWPLMCSRVHRIALMIENQVWSQQSPLWQVANLRRPGMSTLLKKLDVIAKAIDLETLRTFELNDLKHICPIYPDEYKEMQKLLNV